MRSREIWGGFFRNAGGNPRCGIVDKLRVVCSEKTALFTNAAIAQAHDCGFIKIGDGKSPVRRIVAQFDGTTMGLTRLFDRSVLQQWAAWL